MGVPTNVTSIVARAVLGNIGPRSFLYGPRCARSVLPRPRANIPQYGPLARLVRKLLMHLSLTNQKCNILLSL